MELHLSRKHHDRPALSTALASRRRLEVSRCWMRTGQALAYVYARETKAEAETAKVLTMDEARRVASNIAKLPALLASKKGA